MANIHEYFVTPSLVPDGLQSREDWGTSSPASPPPYSPWSYEYRYEPHDGPPRDCLHAILCDQRFATLEALLVALDEHCKRPPCRCRRSTWCRTKSFFGSVKRALSIKSRRKPQPDASQATPSELSQEEHGSESPSESQRMSWLEELPGFSVPVELPHGRGLAPELAGNSWSCPRSQRRAGASPIFELPAQLSDPTSNTATPSINTPSKSSTGLSFASLSSTSSQGSYSTFSPQSSISSVSTAPSTPPKPVNDGAPLFATDTTYSPIEYDNVSPWDKHPAAAELPASLPDSVFETTRWLREPGSAGSPLQLGRATPLNSYPTPSPPQSSGSIDSVVSGYGGQKTIGSENKPSPGPGLPSTPPSQPIDLDNVRRNFSELRRNPAWQGISVGTLSEMGDEGALLSGLDELESIWQGQMGDSVLRELCLVYLTLAMADEMGDAIPPSDRVMLHEGMARFVRSEGKCGLPECFLAVSNVFLNALHAQFKPGLNWRHNLTQMMVGERRPAMLALAHMRAHFQTHSPTPLTRRHSWDSTRSTVLDLAMPDEPRRANTMESFDDPTDLSAASTPSQQSLAQDTPPTLQNDQQQSTCCDPCGYYPRDGPDQRKKMKRHKKTNKHRRITGEGKGGTYLCPIPGCGKTYNREDNLVQHVRKHGGQRGVTEARVKKRIWRYRKSGAVARVAVEAGQGGWEK